LGQALSKTLATDELNYLKEQFSLLQPNKNDTISLENIKAVSFFLTIFIYIVSDWCYNSHKIELARP
jgi:hypothetical protein